MQFYHNKSCSTRYALNVKYLQGLIKCTLRLSDITPKLKPRKPFYIKCAKYGFWSALSFYI